MYTPRQYWKFVTQTFQEWNEDNVPQLGAALAFYAAFSIAPLLVIALSVAALFFGEDAVRGEIARQTQTLMGDQAGKAVEQLIVNAKEPTAGSVAAALSLAVLLFGASGVFGQLQSSLNTIWKVKVRKGRGWVRLITDRLLSFVMVLCCCTLLLFLLVISAILSSLDTQLSERWDWVMQMNHFGTSWLMVMLLFAIAFKMLPDVKVRWRDVWLGAAVTAVLFVLGKIAIGWYLGQTTLASSYGLAGSFIALLLWVYYSSQIFYLGAEMTQVYAKLTRPVIEAQPNAEKCEEPGKHSGPDRADVV
jgi:membrane protein